MSPNTKVALVILAAAVGLTWPVAVFMLGVYCFKRSFYPDDFGAAMTVIFLADFAFVVYVVTAWAVCSTKKCPWYEGAAWALLGIILVLVLLALASNKRGHSFHFYETQRPLNRCHACGHTWYPRGSDYSLYCPGCGAPR